MIETLELLRPCECRATVAALDTLEADWTDRSPRGDRTFYTLGRASYLDVCAPGVDSSSAYYAHLGVTNAFLREHFGTLYQRLMGGLHDHLGGEITLADALAIPGFHIFRGTGIVGAGEAGRHFDIQYERLALPEGKIAGEPLSFTLALELPQHGSGLDVWDITVEDYDRAYAAGRIASLDDMARRRIRTYRPYAVGSLLLQRGLWLHRICSPGPVRPGDRRITLQGHGLYIAGRWLLYW